MENQVLVERCDEYNSAIVDNCFNYFDRIFSRNISPGQKVVLKPNWISPHHKYNKQEWKSVITHPEIITGVIKKVSKYLKNSGEIVVADGPQTDSSFDEILNKAPILDWEKICRTQNIKFQIIDLRDHVWRNKGDLIVDRKDLPGDPRGSLEFNLKGNSEFIDHKPTLMGYYGADYNIKETNMAHSQGNHKYRVSKSAINADVFINIPKLKVHKKAGITCSLKNLVGINTYKNFLPHHTEGTPKKGGDQFPDNKKKNQLEVILLRIFKRLLLVNDKYNKSMIPVKNLGKKVFGETKDTIRSGNWYGNDTLWRTILDLNKILFYGNSAGGLREPILKNRKNYISIVDGVIAGEGNGPEAPDPVMTNLIFAGENPVSVDCVAAKIIGFDYTLIPSLKKAFEIKKYPLCDFGYNDILLSSQTIKKYNSKLYKLPTNMCHEFKPHFGWINNIELRP